VTGDRGVVTPDNFEAACLLLDRMYARDGFPSQDEIEAMHDSLVELAISDPAAKPGDMIHDAYLWRHKETEAKKALEFAREQGVGQ
jgi:hypothetical protein